MLYCVHLVHVRNRVLLFSLLFLKNFVTPSLLRSKRAARLETLLALTYQLSYKPLHHH